MATELKHTVKPSGGDFTTLSDAIAHLKSAHSDLTAGDNYAVIEISGTWSSADTTAVLLNDIKTSPTCYLKITTDTANRAGKSWSTGKYLLSVTDALPITWSQATGQLQHLILDGLQIATVSPTGNAKGVISCGGTAADSGNYGYISNCLLKGHGNATYWQRGIHALISGQNIYVWNTIVYGLGDNADAVGIYAEGSANIWTYNCVVVNPSASGFGVRNDGAAGFVAKNTYVTAGGNCFMGTITKTYCASDDTTADGTNCLTNVAYDTSTGTGHSGFTNVTSGSEDFTLKVGSALDGTGNAPGGSAPLNYTTDIDGQTVSTWCIGADSYPATAQFARPAYYYAQL